jgi:hypothetical protein
MIPKRTFLSLAVGLLAIAVVASADNGNDGGLISTLIGSTPGQSIGGVNSGGAAWTLGSGHITLNAQGELNLVVHGLVLPSLGNAGPVTQVEASLVCGGSGGTIAATTDAVSLNSSGDAHIIGNITIPASCIGPVILVRAAMVNGSAPATPPFIAATGLAASNAGQNGEGDDPGNPHKHQH